MAYNLSVFSIPLVLQYNKMDLKEEGVLFLQLDREYVLGGKGQLRTRVQAFLETIGR